MPNLMRIPAWGIFLTAGLTLVPVYFMLTGFAQDSLYDVFNLAAAVAILVGVRRFRPADPIPWYLFACGQLLLGMGDVSYNVWENILHVSAPFPSLADAFYLMSYPFTVLGMIRLISRLGLPNTRGALIDAALIATSFAVVAWLVLVGPYATEETLSHGQRLVSIAYPVMDLIVLAVGARLLFAVPVRPRALNLVLVATVLHCITDWSYAALVLAGTYQSGVFTDAGWLVCATLVGAAALHPSMAAARAAAQPATGVSVRRLLVVAAAALVAPICIAIDATGRGDLDIFIVTAGAMLTVVLAIGRAGGLSRESDKLRADLVGREKRFRALVHNASDVFVVLGADGTVRYESPAVRRVLGQIADDRVGVRFADLVHPGDADAVSQLIRELARHEGAQVSTTWRVEHASGSWRTVEAVATNLLAESGVEGLVINYRDVTDRVVLEDQLKRQAFHDKLTGLPNHALFLDRLNHALAQSARDGTVAVLFIDLDDFKTVNDGLGHAVGDELLGHVASRFAGCLRAGDTLARLGGDEFAVVLRGVADVSNAQAVANRVLNSLERPFVLAHRDVYAHASIGIAVATSADQPAEELMRDADVAMYMAKRRGKARCEVFVPTMQLAAFQRLDLIGALQQAVARKEFFLEYQPVVALATGAMTGVEALVRWNDPERGRVAPNDFIPLAVETGLIVPIGRWVLSTACRDVRAWQLRSATGPRLTLNVNLSVRQLQHPELVSEVAEALATSGLAPHDLVLEITETDLMHEVESGIAKLHLLRQLGVRLAIDDFGTGYSSLGYLRRLPAEIVKIDRSFVEGIGTDPRAFALAEAMVRLGQTLQMEVVAEGIETVEQADILRGWGCAVGQGYHYARPLAAEEITRRLDDQAPTEPRGARLGRSGPDPLPRLMLPVPVVGTP